MADNGHNHDHHDHDHGQDHNHDHNHDHNEPDLPVNEGAESLVGALRVLFIALRVIMLILVVLLFRTGCFTVKPTEQTLSFRFGALLEKEDGSAVYTSGQSKAFWVWPQPIGNTLSMPSKTMPLSVSTNRFWHQKSQSVVQGPEQALQDSKEPLMLGKDGYVLTGDSYMFHIKATMTFYITNARAYYESFYKLDEAGNFDGESSSILAQDIITSHLEQAIAMESTKWKVDDAFYDKINTYRANVLMRVTADIAKLGYGITIDRIDIKAEDRKPLKQVQATFNNVRKAQTEARKSITEAEKEATQIRLRADKEAKKIKYEASVDAKNLLDRLENFKKLDEGSDNEALVHLYLEAMEKILENVDHRFVIRKDSKGSDVYWLQLGPEQQTQDDGGDDASE